MACEFKCDGGGGGEDDKKLNSNLCFNDMQLLIMQW